MDPELGKEHTGVIVCDVDTLPLWGAQRLREIIERERTRRAEEPQPLSLALTAQDFRDIPDSLASLVEKVVQVPPLRERPEDVLPLAEHVARRARGRDVGFTRTAERVLRDCTWPGNVDQLTGAVRAAALRTDLIDVHHLPSEVLSGPGRRLSRLEIVEREEIVRALTVPGATVKSAAETLGMSRATIYRKVSQYDLHIPGRAERRSG